MKVFPLVSACFVQLLAQRVAASGLIVEFNQDLVIDRSVLLSAHGAQLPNANVLASDGEDDDPLTDRDYFLRAHPGAKWPWDDQKPVTSVVATPPEEPTTPVEDPTAVSLVSRELIAADAGATVECSNTDSTPYAPDVNVLVLISDCSLADLDWIDAWVDNLSKEDSRYFARGAASNIKYVKRYVNGCGKDVGPGRTKFKSNEAPPPNTIAAITFITGEKSLGKVKNYVKNKHIAMLIGFQNSKSLPNKIDGFSYYTSKETLDALNPYSAVRLLHCANLPNGVPTSYVDENGKRKCFCACPNGYKLDSYDAKCVATRDPKCECAWDKKKSGYTFTIEAGNKDEYEGEYGSCSIQNLAGGKYLPVPIAIDNYVAYHRDNLRDGDLATDRTGPRLELQTTNENGPTYGEVEDAEEVSGPTVFTWKDFLRDPKSKVDDITFSRAGKYSLELTAWDYSMDEAKCAACVVVLDKRRPSINANYKCPKDCEADSLTTADLAKLQAAVTAVADLKEHADNDPCGSTKRCDKDARTIKEFVDAANQGETKANHENVDSVFGADAVISDLLEKLKPSPLDATAPSGVASTVSTSCSRCIDLSTELKEWWTEYSCKGGYEEPTCDGDAKCSTKQCLHVDGTDIATATSSIDSGVVEKSKNVVKHLNNDEAKPDADLEAKYSLGDTVHVALHCTKFKSSADATVADGETCDYTAKISDLIDIDASWASALFPAAADVDKYVKWHYQVDGGSWKAWDPAAGTGEHTFHTQLSKITIEAWTQCGMVKKFEYYVKLHLNNEIKVCEHFPKMWYQTTSPPLLALPNSFCMFPKSDFAEVSFDYHPNIGLDFDVEKFQMSISRVVCTMKYHGHEEVTVVDTTGADKSTTLEIVKQFAINGVEKATTNEDTQLSVECTFTYTRKPDGNTVDHLCPLDFVIKDCTPPVIVDKPCAYEGKCDYTQCSEAGSGGPDLFQSCEGNRITQNSAGDKTVLTTGEATCCESCTAPFGTACVSIQEFPPYISEKFSPIKRCEPVETHAYDLMAATEPETLTQTHAMTALLGASAMVAVVALVVVVRRRAVAKAAVEDEAYYALLS